MIEINNVSKSYGSFQVLKNCSASIADGEVVVICGPSGSGKSTLIKTVNGLEAIDSGEINVSGFRLAHGVTNVAALRRSVGMVFQSFELFPQAIRNVLPILLTQTIVLFQDTSLVYVISATDLLGAATKIAQRDGRLVEMYLTVGVIYFLFCFSASQFVKQLQGRLAYGAR